jgi:hypothetical protein
MALNLAAIGFNVRSPYSGGLGAMPQSEFLRFEDVVILLRAEIAAAGSQSEWARKHGVDRATLSAALAGRRNLQPRVLEALRLEQVTVYRRL